MADVCFSSGGCPTSESRKRRAGGFDAGEGCGSTWFKRHRTGNSFARRLLHLRGFAVDVRQAEDLARFIDLLPLEMEQVSHTPQRRCRGPPSGGEKKPWGSGVVSFSRAALHLKEPLVFLLFLRDGTVARHRFSPAAAAFLTRRCVSFPTRARRKCPLSWRSART